MKARVTGIGPPHAVRAPRGEEAREKARELLNFVGLQRRHQELAMNLPYGDQRRLEIARALALGPEAAAARRADRGHEPAGVRGAAPADGEAADRARASRSC